MSPSTAQLRSVDVHEWSLTPPTLPFSVIDVETTGLSGAKDRVIEIAVVHCDPDGTITSEWSTLVDPGRDPGPTHIHGIRASDLVGAPSFAEIAPELAAHLEGTMITAHNLAFDSSFLHHEFDRAGVDQPSEPALCTLELARLVLSDQRSHSLAACAAALGIAHPAAHRALPDTRVTAEVLRSMLRLLHEPEAQARLFD